jgi:hypothetical protein
VFPAQLKLKQFADFSVVLYAGNITAGIKNEDARTAIDTAAIMMTFLVCGVIALKIWIVHLLYFCMSFFLTLAIIINVP